jgi:DNA-binding GntR family transcriptional regulator
MQLPSASSQRSSRRGTTTPFKSINEMITDNLRAAILERDLQEGEYLRQRVLAQHYGVSEVVVREALRRLEAEGLVDMERRKGARVSRLSVAEIRELYDMRILLEEHVARQAAPNFTPVELAQAERILIAMSRLRDPLKWLTLNRDFHSTLYLPSGCLRILKFVDDLRTMVERYLYVCLAVLRRFDVAQGEHEEILKAFSAHDPELAPKLVGAHLQHTAEMIIAHLGTQHAVKERERSRD